MANRDIDQIIVLLASLFPAIEVEQLKVAHPGADDDGIWFFNHPSSSNDVQLESSFGMCPSSSSRATARPVMRPPLMPPP